LAGGLEPRATLDYIRPMRAVRRRLRACAWLALLSIIALAAGPTVSRMLLPAGGAIMLGSGSHTLVEPATADATAAGSAHHHHHGMVMGSTTAPVAPPAPAHEHALEHCGLCLLAAHAFTFVQHQPALTAFAGCTRPVLTPMAPAVPRLRCDWSPASSRGPPPQA
jgi:hypothetical protein